ncbi:Nucleoside phosphorylase domain-containing protein [uncultured Gammaproteobacteria bacterium]
MNRWGVVTGLRAEARIAETAFGRGWVVCAGPGPAHARRAALALVERGAAGLVSFGIAGGLDPSLRPGTLILAGTVIGPGGEIWSCDADGVRELTHRVGALANPPAFVTGVRIAGSDSAVVSVADKRVMVEAVTAAAVDMESHAVAAMAEERGLPLLVIRAVADPAGRSLPPLALAGIAGDGSTRPWAVVAKLLLAPQHLPALLRLASDSSAGFAALSALAAGWHDHRTPGTAHLPGHPPGHPPG